MAHDFLDQCDVAAWRCGLGKLWRDIVLMAFVGTHVCAAMIALSAGILCCHEFLAVFGPSCSRCGCIFDFLRGVDGLIWTHHPFARLRPGADDRGAGHFASPIPGRFGKTFSEALENIDNKQRGGCSSRLGANPRLQQARFGVMCRK
jgi:phosphonate transport system permease protein